MKITFDIDGVLSHYPDILFPLIALLRASKHEVGICTGRALSGIPQDLRDQFDFVISADGEDDEMTVLGHLAKDDEEKMCVWKPIVMRKHGIDLHFDDWADKMDDFGGIAVRIGLPKSD